MTLCDSFSTSTHRVFCVWSVFLPYAITATSSSSVHTNSAIIKLNISDLTTITTASLATQSYIDLIRDSPGKGRTSKAQKMISDQRTAQFIMIENAAFTVHTLEEKRKQVVQSPVESD